ncbi:hypothetical protein CSA37_00730 [Candidatus Fermentibacteria bacterium]|nr:MAG: hypothetical protein CSA37_00730 [Candidatus Fermentibacteria bacterium]
MHENRQRAGENLQGCYNQNFSDYRWNTQLAFWKSSDWALVTIRITLISHGTRSFIALLL